MASTAGGTYTVWRGGSRSLTLLLTVVWAVLMVVMGRGVVRRTTERSWSQWHSPVPGRGFDGCLSCNDIRTSRSADNWPTSGLLGGLQHDTNCQWTITSTHSIIGGAGPNTKPVTNQLPLSLYLSANWPGG